MNDETLNPFGDIELLDPIYFEEDLEAELDRQVEAHVQRYSNVGRKPLPPGMRHVQGSGSAIKEVNDTWHKALVDYFLLNPKANQNDAANYFSKTPGWISQIMNSDAFKEYYAQRIYEHQKFVSLHIVNQTQEMTQRGLEKLTKKLNSEDLPVAQIKDITEMGLKSLGFGGRVAPQVHVDARQYGDRYTDVSPEILQNARAKMAKVVGQNTVQVDEDIAEAEFEEQEREAERIETQEAQKLLSRGDDS